MECRRHTGDDKLCELYRRHIAGQPLKLRTSFFNHSTVLHVSPPKKDMLWRETLEQDSRSHHMRIPPFILFQHPIMQSGPNKNASITFSAELAAPTVALESWGFSTTSITCECGSAFEDIQHLLIFPNLLTSCSTKNIVLYSLQYTRRTMHETVGKHVICQSRNDKIVCFLISNGAK